MPDKSFEEKVQEQLAGLRMKPDAAVWDGVSAALHQERKRRWVIWLIVLLAGLGAGYFWLYQPATTGKNKLITAKQKTTATVQQKIQQPGNETEGVTGNLSPEKPATQTVINIRTQKRNRVKDASYAVQSMPVQQHMAHDGSPEAQLIPVPVVVVVATGKTVPANNRAIPDTTAVKQDILARVSPAPGYPTDSVAVEQVAVKDPVVVTNRIDDSVVKIIPLINAVADKPQPDIQIKKRYPWYWHFSFYAGMSGTRNSLGKLLSPSSLRDNNAFSSLQQGSNTPPSSGMADSYKPVVKDAFSYGIAIQATKQVLKKQQLGLSLGYELYQTRTGVGKRTDSTIFFNSVNRANEEKAYYSGKDSNRYYNRYHFIQVAASLYTPIHIFKKTPVRWQLGAGMNLMLASNGLHYASSGTNYYLFRNRSLLTTVQAQLTTGFDIGIGKQKQVYIGPQFRYFITNLSKQAGVNQHLFQAVLKTTVVIPKKNKQVQR